MFQLPRSLRLLAVSLLACVIPIGAARAEHFKFIVVFLDGSLSGSVHAGYFTTNKPTGDFTPDAHIGGQLMSLIISIDGAWFMMQDDKDFPWLPRVKVQESEPHAHLRLRRQQGQRHGPARQMGLDAPQHL